MKKTLLILLLSALTATAADDNKHCYIQVTADFKTANEGYRSGSNVLRTITDTAGHIYVSVNAVNEFPELFDERTKATFYWLTPDAFPQDTTNGNF